MRTATLMLFVISLSAALSAQTWEAAFRGSDGDLWVVDNVYFTSGGATGAYDTGEAMMAGTSPSITGLSSGGYAVAFQGPTGYLWVYDGAGGEEFPLGMKAGTPFT
ncbi:MAG: hypothetical protein WCA49_02205 [Candidatus Sulfotelmatobacter sp.]